MLNILSINLLYLHCIKSIVYGETDYQGNYCGTPKRDSQGSAYRETNTI